MFGKGKRKYPLYTEERKTKKQRLNPALPQEIKNTLGASKQDIEKMQANVGKINVLDKTIGEKENEIENLRTKGESENMKQKLIIFQFN